MVEPTTLLGGGAALAGIYAAWGYIKVYLSKIYSLFFVRISLTDQDLQNAIIVWAMLQTKPSKFTIRHFIGSIDFIKPKQKNQVIAYEILSPEPTIYWYKKKPLIISGSNITFFRWSFNTEELVKEIISFYNDSQGDTRKDDNNRFYIRKYVGTLQNRYKDGSSQKVEASPSYGESSPPAIAKDRNISSIQYALSPLGWDKNDIGQIKKPDPMEHLALSQDAIKAIDEIRRWRKSEEWYKSKQIPHKKGILLYGKPGCGKSSVAKALAMELNMPIMIFDLSNMSNSDFQENWDRVKNNAPCMVLLEDIDSIFDGRKNIVHDEGGLSFDCLLNCIDGVENSDGILIVATTNNIEKIDVALGKPNGDGISTRPGRIDRAIELLPPDKDGRFKIARRILGDFPDYIELTVVEGHHDTGAQFQERCSRLALRLFWENKENPK